MYINGFVTKIKKFYPYMSNYQTRIEHHTLGMAHTVCVVVLIPPIGNRLLLSFKRCGNNDIVVGGVCIKYIVKFV